MARLLVGMYKLSKPFSPDSEPSCGQWAECRHFDTERRACPQPAAFFSRRTRITPSTYVYTSFVSDLVLTKSVAVGKTPRTNFTVRSLGVLAAYCVGMLPSL